jgi:hypothetical protein
MLRLAAAAAAGAINGCALPWRGRLLLLPLLLPLPLCLLLLLLLDDGAQQIKLLCRHACARQQRRAKSAGVQLLCMVEAGQEQADPGASTGAARRRESVAKGLNH